MQSYIFHQLGVIPGIPGTFGNCRVDIDDEGITETPLAPIPDRDVVAEDVPEVPNPQSLGTHLEIAQEQETVQQPEPPVIVRTAPFSTSTGG